MVPPVTTPQHHIIKETSESLSRLLQDEFKRNGYKRVHIVEQAPKPDAIEGKLPAVSVYLYQLSIDPEGSILELKGEPVLRVLPMIEGELAVVRAKLKAAILLRRDESRRLNGEWEAADRELWEHRV